jgi:hypothetical protein
VAAAGFGSGRACSAGFGSVAVDGEVNDVGSGGFGGSLGGGGRSVAAGAGSGAVAVGCEATHGDSGAIDDDGAVVDGDSAAADDDGAAIDDDGGAADIGSAGGSDCDAGDGTDSNASFSPVHSRNSPQEPQKSSVSALWPPQERQTITGHLPPLGALLVPSLVVARPAAKPPSDENGGARHCPFGKSAQPVRTLVAAGPSALRISVPENPVLSALK